MTYKEKLKDPRWQKKRLEIFNRDNFTCQNCYSDDKTLNVHHLCYIQHKDPWDYPNYFLQTLCDVCHEKATEVDKELNEPMRRRLLIGLESPFIKSCAHHVLSTYNISDLFFYLWEWRNDPEKAISVLRESQPSYWKLKEEFEKIING